MLAKMEELLLSGEYSFCHGEKRLRRRPPWLYLDLKYHGQDFILGKFKREYNFQPSRLPLFLLLSTTILKRS